MVSSPKLAQLKSRELQPEAPEPKPGSTLLAQNGHIDPAVAVRLAAQKPFIKPRSTAQSKLNAILRMYYQEEKSLKELLNDTNLTNIKNKIELLSALSIKQFVSEREIVKGVIELRHLLGDLKSEYKIMQSFEKQEGVLYLDRLLASFIMDKNEDFWRNLKIYYEYEDKLAAEKGYEPKPIMFSEEPHNSSNLKTVLDSKKVEKDESEIKVPKKP